MTKFAGVGTEVVFERQYVRYLPAGATFMISISELIHVFFHKRDSFYFISPTLTQKMVSYITEELARKLPAFLGITTLGKTTYYFEKCMGTIYNVYVITDSKVAVCSIVFGGSQTLELSIIHMSEGCVHEMAFVSHDTSKGILKLRDANGYRFAPVTPLTL